MAGSVVHALADAAGSALAVALASTLVSAGEFGAASVVLTFIGVFFVAFGNKVLEKRRSVNVERARLLGLENDAEFKQMFLDTASDVAAFELAMFVLFSSLLALTLYLSDAKIIPALAAIVASGFLAALACIFFALWFTARRHLRKWVRDRWPR